MSARNSRAAKAARRAGRENRRLPLEVAWTGQVSKAAIAAAVHEALTSVGGVNGNRMCAYYAAAGAMVATVATGQQFGFQAGGVCIDVRKVAGAGPGKQVRDDYVVGPGWDNAPPGDFHAWFTRVPAGAPVESVWSMPPWYEVADLSLRHFRAQVGKAFGHRYRDDLPDYWWASASATGAGIRAWYKPSRGLTLEVNEVFLGRPEVRLVVDEVATVASRKLGLCEPGLRLDRRAS